MRLHGLWRHPGFVRLWAGSTISIFGSLIGGLALQFTAILWLHASALQVSLLALCQLVPGFLLGPAAGVWVDRLRRRPLLIAADAGRAAALASIPLAALTGVLTLPQLYAVALVGSGLTVLFDTAYQAYLPSLVPPGALVEGNSKLAATASVAEFGSFSLSGWLVQAITGPGAVLVDAGSFLASALCIWRIREPEPPAAPAHERVSPWREARDGLAFVAREPLLRSLAAAEVVLQVSSRMVGAVFLLYLTREVGFEPGVLGLIFAVGGLTSLGGSLLASRAHWFGGLGPSLVISLVFRAAGMVCMPLAGSVSLAGGALLVANQLLTDPAWTFYDINEVSLRQAITPARLQGRMNASMRFAGFGGMLAGTLAGGLLGEAIGLRATLFVAAGLPLLAAAWLALSPVAALRRHPATPAPASPLLEGERF